MHGIGTGHANARATIIDAVRAARTVSRTTLVAATGLTSSTVSKEVRALIEDGLLVETGNARSTGGRSQVILELDRSSRFAAGLHLDHDGVTAVLLDLGGTVVEETRIEWPSDAEPAAVVATVLARIDDMVCAVGADRSRLLGIGLVSPGPVTPGEGIVAARPELQGWVRFPFADELREASGLVVVVDNDATAASIGELWTGGARGATVFSSLYMATGIGAGTVVDGAPYRGMSLSVGEVGHTCVDLDGPLCWCGSRGCLEAVAGPGAVVADARAAGILPRGGKHSTVDQFADVVAAARQGDGTAVAILERSAQYLAVAAQTLCLLMSVDLIILTGTAFDIAGDLYVGAVRDRLRQTLLTRGAGEIKVEVSRHARHASAVGAAALVMQETLVPRQFSTRLDAPFVSA